MKYQYHPYVWLLIASSIITLSLGIYALVRRRHAKGAATFGLTMLVVTCWSIIYALSFSCTDLPTRIFWNNIIYIPIGLTPVLMLALAMQFTGYDDWVYSKKIWWLTIPLLVFFLIKLTDVKYGLIYNDMRLSHIGSQIIMKKNFGPVFYVGIAYILSLTITSLVLLIRGLFIKNTIYRRQSFALLAAFTLPHIHYIYFLFTKDSILKPVDATIVSFGPAGLILAWGIFRFKLFDLVPVARATVFETMDTGVMVLDLQHRVIDINPAFGKILGWPLALVTGQRIEEVCPIPGLLAACLDESNREAEVTIASGDISSDYQLLLSPLTDNHDRLIGRLVIAYDITERKKAQQYYLQQQARMAVTEEQERIARDMHDNLGQLLGFINLQAQGIKQEFLNAGVEIATNSLDKLVLVAQAAHNEIREYIHNARNPGMIEKDFISVLTHELLSFKEQNDISIIYDIPPGFTGQELLPDIKVNILNIIKEAFNNVVKHAEALNVKLSLEHGRDFLRFTVEDDGKGFDVQYNECNPDKFGLSIMKERANEIGAEIDIQSTPGQGTRISLRVPAKRLEVKHYAAVTG